MSPASSDSSPTFNPTLQRSRMTKSKATSSTTAIQPLEITTTAVVMSDAMRKNTDTCPADLLPLPGTEECTKKDEGDRHREGYGWKQPVHHHTHHHSIKSPNTHTGERLKTRSHPIVNLPTSPNISPLNCSRVVTPLTSNTEPVFSVLPPPALKTTSDAMTALQDAAKATKKKKITIPFTNTSNSLAELFESSFFSAVLLVQWSNVVGPKTEKVWSAEEMDERLEKTIGRQILNGEMGRNLNQDEVEAKWVVLHRQAIVCTGFLYNDQIVGSLCGLVLVVPTRYLRNFSQYFGVLQERVPIELVKPLVQLRKAYKRHPGMTWATALDYFTWRRLIPFVRSIMNLESVSLPTECIKISHTILNNESRQMLDSPFIAKVITSHLQTGGSTVLIGNTLTTMNMVINTLALFLSSEERSRSSHARKNHPYMADLYLQGLLIEDMEDTNTKLETKVLQSSLPTTLVDMTRLVVKQTPMFPSYNQHQNQYLAYINSKLDEELCIFASGQTRSSAPSADSGWKRHNIFNRTEAIAPLVQTLLDETRKVPTRMREAYIQQWRHLLIRKALALIKWVEEEARCFPLAQSNSGGSSDAPVTKDIVTHLMDALELNNWTDFSIILTQAEKLKKGMVMFLSTYSKRL